MIDRLFIFSGFARVQENLVVFFLIWKNFFLNLKTIFFEGRETGSVLMQKKSWRMTYNTTI
jgi:hypothetical protein